MKIGCYAHAGSKNHGCEAIVRGTLKLLNNYDITLFSFNQREDIEYGLDKRCSIIKSGFNKIDEPVKWIVSAVLCRLKIFSYGLKNCYYAINSNHRIQLSIGGDNYCYKQKWLADTNLKLTSKGITTILWGCSIEPELLKDPEVVEDMKRYSLITARESITYDALMNAGVIKNTKLYPDPAFILDTVKLSLPNNFLENKTIGINLSPLIQALEHNNNVTINNYKTLISHIIDNTDYNIALIPHVVSEKGSDLVSLTYLYDEFKHTGRIVLIGDHNCEELKGYISRCKLFIGARTHATIAAYSTCVPTLVLGYSVKAKGIAKDIFGTYENYVLSVQSLKNEKELTQAFEWLCDHENEIREHLEKFMPSYKERVWQAAEELRLLIGE